jgi:hypothetical protein
MTAKPLQPNLMFFSLSLSLWIELTKFREFSPCPCPRPVSLAELKKPCGPETVLKMQTEISSAHNWTTLLITACENVEGLLGDLWLSGNWSKCTNNFTSCKKLPQRKQTASKRSARGRPQRQRRLLRSEQPRERERRPPAGGGRGGVVGRKYSRWENQ